MGKKSEIQGSTDYDSVLESPSSSHKKHKKHKKKHKRRRELAESISFTSPSSSHPSSGSTTPKPAIKLKLKIGTETLGTKSFSTDGSSVSALGILSPDEPLVNIDDIWEDEKDTDDKDKDLEKIKKPGGDETSDEEQAWLNALESGELDEFEEKQKQKDPTLLTKRQRALLHGRQDHELLQLPSGYKNVQLTEEQVEKRQQRAKKRRQQAQEKREKDKKQTLDRLLKKQDSKQKGPKGRGSRRVNFPRVRYINKVDGISISMPPGFQFPFAAQTQKIPPKTQMCGLMGCKNPKKYNCSKTGVPLCSLSCYKKNLSLHPHLTYVSVT
ncbi:INO80 complex subunit B-like [Gigantopelta aegis]|uniref:INO80 complex subunit B-like n=1 Tax=Gigantopelta aegis TaxID=1735272 RepID=UPI001B888A66|nr:INO80 complex subunit B-like [Gigantopelta aegis]